MGTKSGCARGNAWEIWEEEDNGHLTTKRVTYMRIHAAWTTTSKEKKIEVLSPPVTAQKCDEDESHERHATYHQLQQHENRQAEMRGAHGRSVTVGGSTSKIHPPAPLHPFLPGAQRDVSACKTTRKVSVLRLCKDFADRSLRYRGTGFERATTGRSSARGRKKAASTILQHARHRNTGEC